MKPKLTNKNFIIITIIFTIVLVFSGILLIAASAIPEKTVEVVDYVFIGRVNTFDVNVYIQDDFNYYVEMYAEEEQVGSYIVSTIISTARRFEVPINLAFALAWAESNYNHNCINDKNKDGSFDYGIYQLNIKTFPEQEKYMPVDKNIEAGISYLKSLYDKYGSWDLALVAYNCGSPNYFNPITHAHVKRILKKKDELDSWFHDVLVQRILAIESSKSMIP